MAPLWFLHTSYMKQNKTFKLHYKTVTMLKINCPSNSRAHIVYLKIFMVHFIFIEKSLKLQIKMHNCIFVCYEREPGQGCLCRKMSVKTCMSQKTSQKYEKSSWVGHPNKFCAWKILMLLPHQVSDSLFNITFFYFLVCLFFRHPASR